MNRPGHDAVEVAALFCPRQLPQAVFCRDLALHSAVQLEPDAIGVAGKLSREFAQTESWEV